jgi:hypothetical protein
MNSATWRLQGHHAHLESAALPATLDLAQPWLGLQIPGCDRARFLGVGLDTIGAQQSPQPIDEYDAYVRGNDLVVTYEQTADRPIRTTLYWRALPEEATAGVAVELVVSVQTSLLESRPALEVRSLAPAAELAPGYEQGSACLVRLSGGELSYFEALHPAAYAESSAETGTEGIVVRHRVFFPEELEKGVILRARLRAIVLPRAGDSEAAARYHQSFLASPPPLTT